MTDISKIIGTVRLDLNGDGILDFVTLSRQKGTKGHRDQALAEVKLFADDCQNQQPPCSYDLRNLITQVSNPRLTNSAREQTYLSVTTILPPTRLTFGDKPKAVVAESSAFYFEQHRKVFIHRSQRPQKLKFKIDIWDANNHLIRSAQFYIILDKNGQVADQGLIQAFSEPKHRKHHKEKTS